MNLLLRAIVVLVVVCLVVVPASTKQTIEQNAKLAKLNVKTYSQKVKEAAVATK